MCSARRKRASKTSESPSAASVRVSICTPTYQGLTKLKRTVPVILGELGPSDEIVYVVDGSTDGSAEFLQEHAARDERVRLVVRASNQGRTAAVNAGCRAARGRIVLRADDDVLVPEGFVEAHVLAHDDSDSHVGVVQRISDVYETESGGMWRAFVERNSAADRTRYQSAETGAPACTWGAVCSVERTVGEELGWYDVRFSAYGWEDVEFGYRLVKSGVRIVRLDAVEVRHLAVATSFAGKLTRGFEAGASMGVFAEIHGSDAVLAALGLELSSRERPRCTMSPARRAVLGTGARRTVFAAAARAGECLLRLVRWRRGYDGWVARWLAWSYACGWRDEAVIEGLPLIEPPTAWRVKAVFGPREHWCSIVTAGQASQSSATNQPILRSALLRDIERPKISSVEAWRHAAGAVRRLAGSGARSARPGELLQAEESPGIVFFEECSPSFTLPLVAAVNALELGAIPVVALAASSRVRDEVQRSYGIGCATIKEACPSPRGGRFAVLSAWWGALEVVSGLEAAIERRPWSVPGRLQLVAEAAVAQVFEQRLRAMKSLQSARFVLAVSEYYPSSCALRAAASTVDVPWVTLQHGAVNAMYAPFSADVYLSWSDESQAALRRLQPASSEVVRVVGAPGQVPEMPSEQRIRQLQTECGVDGWRGPVVAFFSQGHGPEFSAATHYDLAGQLRRMMDDIPEAFLLLKRHPAEPDSVYESLLALDRCALVPPGVSSIEVAAVSAVAVALGSTALVDAMVAGCVTVEVLSAEGLLEQAVASTQVAITELAVTVVRILSSPSEHAAALERQTAERTRFVGPDGFAARIISELSGLGLGRAHDAT